MAEINLDDILGELSNLEEQLGLQQEEFAKISSTSTQAKPSIWTSTINHATPSYHQPAYQPGPDTITAQSAYQSGIVTITRGTTVQPVYPPGAKANSQGTPPGTEALIRAVNKPPGSACTSPPHAGSALDPQRGGVDHPRVVSSTPKSALVSRNSSRSQDFGGGCIRTNGGGGERDGRKSVDFDLCDGGDARRGGGEEKIRSVGSAYEKNSNGSFLDKHSSPPPGRREAENGSCSSSLQSFDSDSLPIDSTGRGGAQLHAGPLWGGPQSGGGPLGVSESVQSFGTMSSVSSASSGGSGASTGGGAGSGAGGGAGGGSAEVCFRVYSPDGTSKTVGGDRRTSAAQLCAVLARKNRVAPAPSLALVEQVHDLYMERIVEDHQPVSDVVDCWVKDSLNRLMFADIQQKYAFFNNQQVTFDNDAYTPSMEGMLHVKAEGKKAWRKQFFVLRASGLYYSLKGKGGKQSTSDLVCFQTLRDVDIFTAVNWKKKHKSPTDFGFALKTAMIQKPAPKYIKYLCAEDAGSLWQWVSALRLTKHGRQLQDNHRRAQLAAFGSGSAGSGSASGKLSRSATTIGSGATHQPADDPAGETTDCLPHASGPLNGTLQRPVAPGQSQLQSGPTGHMSRGPAEDGRLVRNGLSDCSAESRKYANNDLVGANTNNASSANNYDRFGEGRRSMRGLGGDERGGGTRIASGGGRSSSTDRLLDERPPLGGLQLPPPPRSSSSDRLLDNEGGGGRGARGEGGYARGSYNERVTDEELRGALVEGGRRDPNGRENKEVYDGYRRDFNEGGKRDFNEGGRGGQHARSSSIDRFLDDRPPSQPPPQHTRSNSSDRLLDDRLPNRDKRASEHTRNGSVDRLLDEGGLGGGRGGRPPHRNSSMDRLLDDSRRRPPRELDSEDELEELERLDTSTLQRRRSSKHSTDSGGGGGVGYFGDDSYYRTPDSRTGSIRRSSQGLLGGMTPNKMFAKLPITTSVTKQMSMQQPYDVRTLPRKPKGSAAGGGSGWGEKEEGGRERPNSNVSERGSVRWSSELSATGDSNSSESSGGGGGNYSELKFAQSPLAGAGGEGSVYAQQGRRGSNPYVSRGEVVGTLTRGGSVKSEARKGGYVPLPAPSMPPPPPPLSGSVDLVRYPSMELPPMPNPPSGATGGAARPLSSDFVLPPPPPSIVQGATRRRPVSPDGPPPAAPTGGGVDSRQRNPSPDFLPPPPPEFLLAFQPTGAAGWEALQVASKGGGIVGSGSNFDVNLENELEYLQQQVSMLGNISGFTTTNAAPPALSQKISPPAQNMPPAASQALAKNSQANQDAARSPGIAAATSPTNQNGRFDYTKQTSVSANQNGIYNSVVSANRGADNQVGSPPNQHIYESLPDRVGSSPVRTNGVTAAHPFIANASRGHSDYGHASNFSDGQSRGSLHSGSVSRTGTLTRGQKPPAPPRRLESTKLSTRAESNMPQTRYIIDDLDRVINQKYSAGAGGVVTLEVPLPPPPPLMLDDRTTVDFGDLPPPPPADLLAGMRTLRRAAPRVPPKRK